MKAADFRQASATAMTEDEFLAAIRQSCRSLNIRTFHPYDSRRSEPGFPDLVIVGVRGVLFRELKTEKGKVTTVQAQWIQALQVAGADAGLWRPSDWHNGRIRTELRRIMQCRV